MEFGFGLIDELGLVELTDELIEPHCLEHISAGQDERRSIIHLLGLPVERYYFERHLVAVWPVVLGWAGLGSAQWGQMRCPRR